MNFYARFGKRLFDAFVVLVAGVLTSPIHGLCALLVAATSGRPIYFSQARAGKDGVPFNLVKFRTMEVGTHEASGGYPTVDMVTPIGRFLRKTSLDEIPQLFNIFKGDMSIVGPRPALLDQARRYDSAQRRRLAVRPGLTGLAQVRYRNNAPWSLRIKSDVEYIDSLSFRRDMMLIIRTLPAVLLGVGVTTGQTSESVDDLPGSTTPPRLS